MKKITILVSSLMMALSLHAQVSEYIHVDQFGYLTDAEKVAVISDPQVGLNADGSFTPGAVLELRRSSDDSIIMTNSPAIWNGGATHAQSGDKGWWFDFSTVTEVGDFYVFDATSGARSATFTIGENPYYDVMKAAARMFYYNRCNAAKEQPYAEANWADPINFTNPLQDANCRYINEPTMPHSKKTLPAVGLMPAITTSTPLLPTAPYNRCSQAMKKHRMYMATTGTCPRAATACLISWTN